MNIKNFDLNLLRALDALLTERNVTRAAHRVGLSQPAMSNALARLRTLLDDPLLLRTPQGMVPTPRGEQLGEPVRQALSQVEQAFTPPAAFDPTTSDRAFVLAATDYMEFVMFPPLARRLAEIGAKVRLRVTPLNEVNLSQALAKGTVDAALGYFHAPEEHLYNRKLFDERFVCLVRKGHPQVKQRLTLKQYVELDHVLISPRGEMRGVVDDILEKQKLQRRVVLSSPHFLLAPHLVADTDYIITLAERVANMFTEMLPVRSFPAPFELPGFSVSLLWHARMQKDPAHRWLREQLIQIGSSV